MDGQVTARTLVCAIPKAVIVRWVNKRLEEMGKVPILFGTPFEVVAAKFENF